MKTRLPMLLKFLDDILFIIGCVCILIGLSLWSAAVTWIAAGVMFICFGLLYARKTAHDSE